MKVVLSLHFVHFGFVLCMLMSMVEPVCACVGAYILAPALTLVKPTLKTCGVDVRLGPSFVKYLWHFKCCNGVVKVCNCVADDEARLGQLPTVRLGSQRAEAPG